MLAVISPAKRLNFKDLAAPISFSQPQFIDRAEQLAAAAARLSQARLGRLMKLNDDLAALNHQRYKAFKTPFTPANARQAVLAFNGDTYLGLKAGTLSEDDLDYAQDHLRILSGLYGLLRPLDLMQPYRLEMGSRLKPPKGGDLYGFWGDDLARSMDAEVAEHHEAVIVNLASKEYFKSVPTESLAARVVTPVFKEVKEGRGRVLGMIAKQSRGKMARYMITERIDKADGLKDFKTGGYTYRADQSEGDTWVFTRPQQPPAGAAKKPT